MNVSREVHENRARESHGTGDSSPRTSSRSTIKQMISADGN